MDLKKKLRDTRHRLWLELARKGNEDAFRHLYREIHDPVAAYVNRRVPQRADAEDLTAEVFRRFVSRLDGYDGGRGSVLTWVLTMARNAVIDHHRRARPDTVPADEMAELLAGDHPGALQSLIQAEDLRRVRSLLLKQPPEIREMFDLRFGQGLRVRQVAEVLGISPDAAKQRFARTLRQLQADLKDELKDNPTPERNRKGESPWAVTD